jgi:hypothetical protein
MHTKRDKFHTALTKSMAFTTAIFTKLTTAQCHYVKILYRVSPKAVKKIWNIREKLIYIPTKIMASYH